MFGSDRGKGKCGAVKLEIWMSVRMFGSKLSLPLHFDIHSHIYIYIYVHRALLIDFEHMLRHFIPADR